MRAHSDAVSQRADAGVAIGVRCRCRWRRLPSIIAAVAMVCFTAGPSAAWAAQVDVASNGRGSVSTAPALPLAADESSDCTGGVPPTEEEPRWCRYTAPDGAAVTFTALPGTTPDATGTRFVGWSDSRCPPVTSCTLTIDDAHISLTALFSPQDILVKASGAGTVSATAADPCPIQDTGIFVGRLACGAYPFATDVTLRSNDTAGRWDPETCDAVGVDAGGLATCNVSAIGLRWARVAFGGADFDPEVPPVIMVHFRVLKRGTGTGIVRGDAIDCGSTCAVDRVFGKRQTLVAQPAPGSVFAGWVGACSTGAQCSLAVGPVTSVVATFASAGGSPPATAPVSNPARRPRVLARLRSVRITGRGRHRMIVLRLQVGEPVTVRVRLSRSGRVVVTRRAGVSAAGVRVVRMAVPRRVHRGLYRLTITVRARSGGTTVLQRRLRVPR